MSSSPTCKVCQSTLTCEYKAREMMFGTRDEFTYFECPTCGCLQIAEIPANIESYYPAYYYSFITEIPLLKRTAKGFKRIIDRLFLAKKERRLRREAQNYLTPISITKDARILDVGCGRGALVCRLFNMGYEHVGGIDKYLPKPIKYDFNVEVQKKGLNEIADESYDLVMMHHVLEHMFDPEQELNECYRILSRKGWLMIRIPIKGYAWEKYQTNWVQLDPPRHFIIHTTESIRMLAQKTGFKVKQIIHDSSAFQFTGSELYQRDISLHDPKTHMPVPSRNFFSRQERRFFRAEAKRLNASQQGDQAIFYLYKD